MPSAGSAPSTSAGPVRSAPWTLVVVCVAVFMLLLDVTVVIVALPDIQADLGGDLGALQWVIDAYALSLAALLLTAATLGDRVGRRRIFLVGLGLFTLASAGCALAWSPLVLDLIRGGQGVGGALLFGTALPLINDAYPGDRERARAIGVFGMTLAAATALGPLVGGLLVEGPGWRWIFLVNLPIGLLALLAGRLLTESFSGTGRRADWPGVALLTTALTALLFAVTRGNARGWTSAEILTLFAAAALLLAGFARRELTAADPMLDLRLFRRPGFAGVWLASFAVSVTLIAAVTYLALFLQNGLGHSPLAAGVRVLPLTVAAFVTAPLAAALVHRVPLRAMVTGALLLAGTGMLAMARPEGGSGWIVLVPGLLVAGGGMGVSSSALAIGALATVEPDRAGMATGTVNTGRQVGVAVGVAALGALFQHVAAERARDLLVGAHLPDAAATALAHAVGGGAGVRAADAVSPALRSTVAGAARTATAEALAQVMLVGGLGALLGAVACWLLIRKPPLPELP